MYNITTFNLSNEFLVPTNQKIYVEDICKPYIQSINRIYLTVAIFNLFYSFVWLWLKNRKERVLFSTVIEGVYVKLTVGHISMMLDTIFFLLNFFIFGYWILINNVETFIKLPFVKWFA